MAYRLLTGATGLLGRYVLRGLLAADAPLAVIVRPSKLASAAARLEASLGPLEAALGRPLPRPVVLAGDLREPQLGLDAASLDWLRDHCDSVLHCAASMVFRQDRHGEPFRTNVDGTRNLVDLCRSLGIGEFHHVSTAYVCGLRTGCVLEAELDLGQQLGNVYEESKLAAEKIVRAADHLTVKTFYRPASIVGDSATGYVTSYHGFYLPLQLAYTTAGRIPPEEMNERFLSALGLVGDEGKNFVCVDWVADAIVHLITHSEHHGQTYHLASPEPVTVRLFQSVVQEAIRRYSRRPIAEATAPEDLAAYEALFHQYMSIYKSHWRNDPEFDLANTRRALPHLPCPPMDFDRLLRVAQYAVEKDFALRKHTDVCLPYDVQGHLARWILAAPTAGNGHAPTRPSLEGVSLRVVGHGGGQWRLLVRDRHVVGAALGILSEEPAGCYLHADTFAALAARQLTVERSLASGRLVLEGAGRNGLELVDIFKQVLAGPGAGGG